MLNPFPIQWLSLFAYFILRFFVGGCLTYLGIKHFIHRDELKHVLRLSWWPYGTFSTWVFIVGELILAGFTFAGAYTQYAMIAIMLMSSKLIILRHLFNHPSIPSRLFYVLLFGAALTLFITGAGVPAFDLPL